MQTLVSLLRAPTKEQLRAQLLAELQGVGFTKLTGYSPGTVTLSGVPTAAYDVRVLIVGSGNLGAATFQYSTDGALTWSSLQTVPVSGTFAVLGSTISIVFANSSDGTTSFIAGDTFRVQTRVPTFPATAWQTGSVPLSLVENDAAVLEDLYALQVAIASGGMLDTAVGPWLDLVAAQVYNLTRNPGVVTVGDVVLTDAGGNGPTTITVGQLWVASTNGLRFNNATGGTLPKNGTLTLSFRAEAPGSAYNVANNTITSLVTALPGVTVNNPSAGTWITTQGANPESDIALASRCRARWPALGTGTPSDAYDLWARTADPSITRTYVRASPTVEGQVDVFLAGTSGPVGAPAVAAAAAYISPRTPLCVTSNVAAAAAVGVTVSGTVYVTTALLAQATAQVATNLQALFAGGTNNLGDTLPGIPIGPATVYLDQIREQIMVALGVRNMALTLPAGDTALTAGQVATLTNSLTFVGV